MTAAKTNVGRSITGASLIMMGSVLLSRVLGIVREMVLAGLGGTSGQMDAYVAAFLVPEFLNHLLAGGFMSITFIPLFHERAERGDTSGAWRLFSNLLTTGTVAMSALVALCLFFTPQILGLLGSKIGGADLSLAVRMTRIILPAQLFFYWGSLFMAVQFAHKQFLLPALAPLFYNGGIIAGGVLLGPRLGIEGFAWGVLGGALVGNALIQVIGLWRVGAQFRPLVDLRDPGLRRYVLLSLPLVLGLGMQFSNEIAFRIFGAFLGEGSLASLNYSLRVMWALVGLFGQAVGIASFPYLTALAAGGKLNEMNQVAFGVLKRIVLLIVPISAVVIALAPELIAVMFQRGRFTAASTAQTAPVLQFHMLGAFAFCAMTILNRCFYALQNTWLPMVVSTAVALAAIPIYWLLSSHWGAPGIALAGSLAALLELTVLLALWTRRHGREAPVSAFLAVGYKSLAAGALAFTVAVQLQSWLWPLGTIQSLGKLGSNLAVGALSGGLAVVAALVVLRLLGVNELAEIWHRVWRRARK